MLTTAEATGELLQAVRALLDDAFAGDFDADDWQHTIGGFHAVLQDGDVLLAHAAVVPAPWRSMSAGCGAGSETRPGDDW